MPAPRILSSPVKEIKRNRHRYASLALLLSAPWALAHQAGHPKPDYQGTAQAIQAQIESNDLAGARTLLASAMKQYPRDGGLETLLGVVDAQSNHRDAARKDFHQAVTDDPKLLSAWQNLARLDMEDADHSPANADDAFRAYVQILKLDPSDAESMYGAATAAMWRHQFGVSLEYLKKLRPEDQARPRVLAIACADEFNMSNVQAGEKAASAMSASTDLEEGDVMLVLPALRAAHRPELLDQLLSAIDARHPLSASALRTLGLAEEAEGKSQQARATLERAYQMDSAAVDPLVDLARIALAQGDKQGALGYLAHARAIAPKNATLAYQYGYVCLQMRLLREAQSSMADAVRLAPDNPDFLLTMGTLATGTDALPYLQRYRDLRPNDPAGFLAQGIALLDSNHPEQASIWLKRAEAFPKTSLSACYYMGRALTEEGRYDEAIEELKRADSLHSDQPEVMAELGTDYFWLKRYQEALVPLRRALELDPENYLANYTLLRLYSQTNDPQRQEQARKFADLRTQREDQYHDAMRVIEARPQPLSDTD
ncbi:tetratricopeptide repeat protein [Silvibacterium sp.]|uniref:tetratricopeptide repeat protein n=1 Tax=Silvibacterium sp. TaxID=1964179 RepID=UPI0039E4DEBD